MKRLYETTINQEREVEEKEVTKNDKNEEITTTKKVKKQFPIKLMIKVPSRKERQAAEEFYASVLGQLVDKGVLTRPRMRKKIMDEGGFLSKSEEEEYMRLFRELETLEVRYQTILLLEETDRTDKEKKEFLEIGEKYAKTQREFS